MPPKPKENETLLAGLDGIKSIQESIASENEKMYAIIEKMKADVTALGTTQAEHSNILEGNSERIKALESTNNHHDDRLTNVEQKMEILERKQEFYQRIEDQDRRILQIMRDIQPAEMLKSSCLILLHGVPLEKSINDLDPRVPEEISLIKNSLSHGLSKRVTDFIFELNREGRFKNISGWSKGPDVCNYRYGDKTPENARNSLMFFCSNRTQALSLEAELRKALIETFPKRKETEHSTMELGIHSENPKIRALHKFLLYKGKLIVENLDNNFDQYRVAFRGGSSRRGGQTTVSLALELRASRRSIENERRRFFLREDGTLIKNPWTDSRNVRISDPLSTWFPPKNEFVERAEKRIVRAANGGEAESAKEKDIKCDIPGCKESFRSRQGLNSHKTKDHNRGIHVVSDSEEDEVEEEENEEDSETEAIPVVKKTTAEVEVHQEGEENDGFTPVNKKKERKKKGVQISEKPLTRNNKKSFAAATASATKQPKITNFGKPGSGVNHALFPVPT